MAQFVFTAPDGTRHRVTAPEGATEADAYRHLRMTMAQGEKPAPVTDSMTRGDKLLSSIGRGFVSTGRGIQQAGAGIGNYLGMVDDSTMAGIDRRITQARDDDAALMDTGLGMTGNVVGSIAATAPLFMLPGAVEGTAVNLAATATNAARAAQLAKLAATAGKVSSVINPATYKGAATVGAGLGALAPVAEGEDRLVNTGAGAVGGLAGRAVAGGVGNAIGYASKLSGRQMPVTPITVSVYTQAQSAAESAGINWGAMDNAAKRKIIQAVQQSLMTKGAVNPQEAARQAVLSSLPKPIQGTRGQVGQEYAQQDRESVLADIPVIGSKIRAMREGQRELIAQNLDEFGRSVGATPMTAQKGGELVRADLVGKRNAVKSGIKALYDDADEVAGGTVVSPQGIANWFNDNAGDETAASLLTAATRRGIVAVDENGVVQPLPSTLRDIYSLRKRAGVYAKDPGSVGHVAGTMKGAIDDIFDESGGQPYKAAAAARRQMAVQFDDNRGVGQIVSKSKSYGQDWRVPDQDVFQRLVVNGSEADLKNYLRLAPDTSPIKSEIVSRIKGAGIEDINGVKVLKLGALEREVDKIGPEKLKMLLGKDGTAQIYKIIEAARILEKKQPSLAGGSQTASRLMSLGQLLINGLDKIPVIGGAASGGAKVILSSAGAHQATTPLQEAMQAAIIQNSPLVSGIRNTGVRAGGSTLPAWLNLTDGNQ